jgi:hypothetical protein
MSDETDLQDAADEWRLSEDGYGHQRAQELADLKFEMGQHWTEADLAWRQKKKKPAFTVDQLSGQVAKVTNAPIQRIVVSPNGGGLDPKSAEYWQGICRRIETLSSAEDVYRWARRHAVVMGRGFWRVRHDYFGAFETNPTGQYDMSVFDNVDIRIEPFVNQHAVRPDPRIRTLDGSDQRFCLITEDLHWPELKRMHPGVTITTRDQSRHMTDVGDAPAEWATENSVRLAERYYIEDEHVTLCALAPGTQLPDGAQSDRPMVIQKDAKATYPKEAILAEHRFTIPRVKWMKYTWFEVIDRADVPGRFIPVVQIVGERRVVNGKTDCRGMVRMAKGPQQLSEFMESRLAEMVDLAAFMTIKAEASTIADFEDEWATLNTERPAVVHWKSARDISGEPLPAPEVLQGHPDVGGIAIAAQRASMMLRGVLGVPDVTPDELRPEQSGRAINARRQEQQQSTSHYADSTAAGIRHTARIIHWMAREVYTAPRILRINGADEKPVEVVTYKGQGQREAAQAMAGQGPQQGQGHAANSHAQLRHMLDLSAGEYDFSVAAGRGYDTMRQEGVDAVTAMVQAFPPMAPKAIPIILKNSDFPGASELAAAMEPEAQPGTVPLEQAQQAQQMIDQLSQQLQKVSEELQSKRDELGAKMAIAQQDTQAKVEIERMKADAAFRLEQMRLTRDVERARLESQVELEKARMAATAQMHSSSHEHRPSPDATGVPE